MLIVYGMVQNCVHNLETNQIFHHSELGSFTKKKCQRLTPYPTDFVVDYYHKALIITRLVAF